jgi:PAS domain S-box-containing protein
MATILIVDDLSDNRQFLVTVLRYHGHRLLEAADGREGLATARDEHPDLVITDVLMPVMDGYELARQLHLDPATRAIPVVFYTAKYGEREARALAGAGGVSDVLPKPTQPDEVLRIVARVLAGDSPPAMPADVAPITNLPDREHLRLLTGRLPENAGDLRTANARLRALINIALELASERGADQLLQRVGVAVRDLFGATYVTLGVLDLNDHTIQRIVTCGAGDGEWAKIGDAVPGILGTVVGERQSLRGDNPGGDPATLRLPVLHPGIDAFLAAPIASAARVYGWICLVRNEGRTFDDDDEHLVMALAGQVGRMYELEHEIVERQQAEASLRLSEERVRFALQAAGVGIWDMDFTTGVLQWSEILESQYGLPPGTFGGTFEAFVERVHPQDRDAVLEAMAKANRSGADFSEQHRTLRADGAVRWLSGAGRIHLGEHGEPVRGIGISLDVTERRRLEEQYRQAQKMEAIGRMAGGVAHDFNNLLTVILGHCDLLLEDLGPEDPRRSDLAGIQKAGESGAALTRQLLAFSRKEMIQPTLLDLNVVVTDTRTMLQRLIGDDVRVVLALRPELPRVKADRGQVEQIVLNLAVNARDAMPRGGTLTIETASVQLDEHSARMHLAVRPGPYVVLTMTDTGAGMTPEVQARLFEPFFTTKEPGKGTGLGLATVHGIVMQSGGSVSVDSEVGKGTAFSMYFPQAAATEVVVEAPTPPARPRAGTETVLVVDDAEGLRVFATMLLERQGYRVLAAGNADEALRLFEQGEAIDVLLTDVVMPGASGPELTRRLIERRPALKVICMSGYAEGAIVHHGMINPKVAFLSKPFTAETLGRKVREALGR